MTGQALFLDNALALINGRGEVLARAFLPDVWYAAIGLHWHWAFF